MKRIYFKSLLVVLVCSLISASCDNDDNQNPEVQKINYSILTETGTFPDKIYYLKGLENLEADKIGTDGAKELTQLGLGYSYKGALYQSSFGAPATLTKYEFDDNGVPIEKGKFIDVTSNTFAKVVFVNDSEAYAHNAGKGSYRIIKFDPSSMEITGEVNLEKLKNPKAKFIMLQGMVYRDGKLYVGVQYSQKPYMLPPAFEEVSVAIIDLSKMNVSKIITDNRTSNLLGSVGSFKLDDSGDLYIIGSGTQKTNNGLLRIKKGKDEFDKTYFVDLKSKMILGKNIMFYGNGKMLLMRLENIKDLWELKGPSFKYCKLDYINKKYLGDLDGVPVSYENSALLKKDKKEGYILNASQKGESTLYKFNASTEKVSKISKVDSKLKSIDIY